MLFKKLASDYKHVLNDVVREKLENNNKMQVEKIEDSNVSWFKEKLTYNNKWQITKFVIYVIIIILMII